MWYIAALLQKQHLQTKHLEAPNITLTTLIIINISIHAQLVAILNNNNNNNNDTNSDTKASLRCVFGHIVVVSLLPSDPRAAPLQRDSILMLLLLLVVVVLLLLLVVVV